MKNDIALRIVLFLLFGVHSYVACAGVTNSVFSDTDNSKQPVNMKYAWLDGTRLFMISLDKNFISQIYSGYCRNTEDNNKVMGLLVLDYNVVPPWNGSIPLESFPAPPRPAILKQSFWLDDVAIQHEKGNLFAQNIFIYDWLKDTPTTWSPGPWLLRTEVSGWPSANLLKTLLCLPDNLNDIDHIQYKGVWISLLNYSGDFRPTGWASSTWLPPDLTSNGQFPVRHSSQYPAPENATFYPREQCYAEAAIRRYPTCPEGYVLRALLECFVNDEAALRDYNQAVSLVSSIPKIFAYRAELFFRHHMVFDAYRDAVRASELDSSYDRIKQYYMNIGNITEEVQK